jgi:[calcium/calmodulin-dependent protein kinase] kinase
VGNGTEGGGGEGGPAGAPVYHTRLNERSHYTVGYENLTWAGGQGEESKPRSLFDALQGQRSGAGMKFADLVAQAVEGARDGKGVEGGSESQGQGQDQA